MSALPKLLRQVAGIVAVVTLLVSQSGAASARILFQNNDLYDMESDGILFNSDLQGGAGSNQAQMQVDSSGHLDFSFDGGVTTAVQIMNTGNVGVGVENPDAKLEVQYTSPDLAADEIVSNIEGNAVGSAADDDSAAIVGSMQNFSANGSPAHGVAYLSTGDWEGDFMTLDKPLSMGVYTMTPGDGNDVSIFAGEAGSTGNPQTGGNVYITGGAGTDGGANGNVIMAYDGGAPVGNVGIGLESPNTNLHIYENNTDTIPALKIEQNSTGDASMLFDSDGNEFAMGIDSSDGDKFKISDNTSLGTKDRLTITSAGNVGINTKSPSAMLQVQGNVRLQGDQAADCDGSADPYGFGSTCGPCLPPAEGSALVAIEAADRLCGDSVLHPTAVRVDLNDDCTDNGGTDGTYILGSSAIAATLSIAVMPLGFVDSNANSAYNIGEDLYVDNVPTGVYSSGNLGVSSATGQLPPYKLVVVDTQTGTTDQSAQMPAAGFRANVVGLNAGASIGSASQAIISGEAGAAFQLIGSVGSAMYDSSRDCANMGGYCLQFAAGAAGLFMIDPATHLDFGKMGQVIGVYGGMQFGDNAYGDPDPSYEITESLTAVRGESNIEAGHDIDVSSAEGVTGGVGVGSDATGININQAISLAANSNEIQGGMNDTAKNTIEDNYGVLAYEQSAGANTNYGVYITGAAHAPMGNYALNIARDDTYLQERLYMGTEGAVGNVNSVLATAEGSLPDATTYYYYVVAVNGDGELTDPSEVTSKTTNDPDLKITVTWNGAEGADSYRVYRSTDGLDFTEYTEIADASTTLVDDGDATPVWYAMPYISPQTVESSLLAGGTLLEDTPYYYAVVGIDGNETMTAPSRVTTQTPGGGDNQIEITWDDTVQVPPGVTKYRIYRGYSATWLSTYLESATSPFTDTGALDWVDSNVPLPAHTVTPFPINVNSVLVAGGSLAPDFDYCYMVVGVDDNGKSMTPSRETCKQTTDTDFTVDVTWEAMPNVSEYRIYRSMYSTGWEAQYYTQTVPPSLTELVDDGTLVWIFGVPPDHNPFPTIKLSERGDSYILHNNFGIGDSSPDHKLDVNGNIGMTAGSYINYGDTDGFGGYGIRDSGGTIEVKNNGGGWSPVSAIGALVNVEQLHFTPEYPDALYDQGSFTGKLEGLYDATEGEYYEWTTTTALDETMTIRLRFKLPADFADSNDLTTRIKTALDDEANNFVGLELYNLTDAKSCASTTNNHTNNAWGALSLSEAAIETNCIPGGAFALSPGDLVEIRVTLMANNNQGAGGVGEAYVSYLDYSYDN